METFVNYFSIFCMFLFGIIFPLVEKINTDEQKGKKTWLTTHISEDMCGNIGGILAIILFFCLMFLTCVDAINCGGHPIDIMSVIICNVLFFLVACMLIGSIPSYLVSILLKGPQTKDEFAILFVYFFSIGCCLAHIYFCETTPQSFKVIYIGVYAIIGILFTLLARAIYEGILWIYKKIKK